MAVGDVLTCRNGAVKIMHDLGDLTHSPVHPHFSFAIVIFFQPNKGVKIAPLKILRLTISARLFNINECTSHLCDELVLPLQGHVIRYFRSTGKRANCAGG